MPSGEGDRAAPPADGRRAWRSGVRNLENSKLAHRLQMIAEFDLDELRAIDPPARLRPRLGPLGPATSQRQGCVRSRSGTRSSRVVIFLKHSPDHRESLTDIPGFLESVEDIQRALIMASRSSESPWQYRSYKDALNWSSNSPDTRAVATLQACHFRELAPPPPPIFDRSFIVGVRPQMPNPNGSWGDKAVEMIIQPPFQ